MKRLALLSSGGDAPGMNAAIRSVVRTALARGCDVLGVYRGYQGLVRGDIHRLTSRSVADIVQRGGTILRTARCKEFMEPEGFQKALDHIRVHRIDGLVVIGGDGSLRGAQVLHEHGVPVVGVPGTIDNDLAYTDFTIGFDTAVNTAVQGINNIRDTATSHERTYVIEVMGRHSGHIALHAGTAGGAECILLPEMPVPLEQVVEQVNRSERLGKAHSIIVVAEGFSGVPQQGLDHPQRESAGFQVGRYIRDHTRHEVRVTVLGHLQRGGNPTAMDRIAATLMGAAAVEALLEGRSGVMVGLSGEDTILTPIPQVLATKKPLNRRLLELASVLGSL